MHTTPLERELGRYCAWFRTVRSLAVLQALLFSALCLMALYVLCDKLFYLAVPYSTAASLVASAALLVLLAFFVAAARKPSFVAYMVDKSAGLRNLVASGLSAAECHDEVSSVVTVRATDALRGLKPVKALPLRLYWTGRYMYVPIAALLASFLMPQVDLAGRRADSRKAEIEQAAVKQGAEKIATKFTMVEEKSKLLESIEGKKIVDDFKVLPQQMTGLSKKEALEKLGEFENKYREDFAGQRDFEQAAKALQAPPDTRGLSPDAAEQLRKLQKNLADGNMKEAAESMRDLAARMAGKDTSAEERRALAREMAKMAEKMQGEKCGAEMAKLMRQIEASEQDIGDLLKQCEKASKDMCELADFCEQCDGLKAMHDGLSDAKREMIGDGFCGFDAAEVEKYMAGEAALGCKGCGSGDGTGGEGMGRGGDPLENATETAFKSKLSPSKINSGKILHQLFVSGIPEKGDALVEYSEVVGAARQHAASSLARDTVPREYEDLVKKYFDTLELKKETSDGAAVPP